MTGEVTDAYWVFQHPRRETTERSRTPPMLRWTPPGWQYGIDVPS
jgi:hypothetical protein